MCACACARAVEETSHLAGRPFSFELTDTLVRPFKSFPIDCGSAENRSAWIAAIVSATSAANVRLTILEGRSPAWREAHAKRDLLQEKELCVS